MAVTQFKTPKSQGRTAAERSFLITWRNIRSPGLDHEFALGFLDHGVDVESQFTCGAVSLLVRGNKSQIVAAPQMIDQRLKSRFEFLRFVREHFATRFVCQRLNVHIVNAPELEYTG